MLYLSSYEPGTSLWIAGGGDEPDAVDGAGLSPHPEAGAHDRRPGRERVDRAGAPGGGAPVPAAVDDGVDQPA